MKILYSYLYSNMGGVCSVIKNRQSFTRMKEASVFACMSQDANGLQDLEDHGIATTIDRDYIKKSIDIANREEVNHFNLIDEAQHIEQVFETIDGRINLELHSSTAKFFDQVNDDRASIVNAIVVPSQWSKSRVLSKLNLRENQKKVHVVPNFVRPFPVAKKIQKDRETKPLLVWVGKLYHGKNWIDALRVFRVIAKEIDAKLVMVNGGVNNANTLDQFFNELQFLRIEDKVSLRMSLDREEIGELLSQTRESGGCMLITSLAESFGLVVCEAMNSGVPVVASDVGALSELVEDGRNGFLFPVGSIEQPVEKVSSILSGKVTFAPDVLRETVREYSDIGNVEKYFDVALGIKMQGATPVFEESRVSSASRVGSNAFVWHR
ncbi:glycosyltransferase family 4 protein [Falsiruegeria mediterranea]|uniref:N-acetyl-alpha-D-glucosaminyl L-malate synthase n=1 Tax=Falsiruegeria mediterranea M17 TaxID=1200281 RepID=A0A2R8CAX1_9RHOB|nr:glycosyltransferase family 4 protein [Falsiruegeria mediterranea]SPJ29590.1 N-acetyl-alpha-D-glucosaminyl L-malate synthase [Falsiruegeria mediterranea M17]